MSTLAFQESSPQTPVVSALIDSLIDFDFSKPTLDTVKDLTAILVDSSRQADPRIPLGTFESSEYSLVTEALGPNSLNSADNRREGSVHELLKDLKLANIKALSLGQESTQQAFALGRLSASHLTKDQIAQSHWVIFLDQTKNLWALYANDIDITDIYGKSNAYNISLDTAFGADCSRKAILLGLMTELPFQRGVNFRNAPQIFVFDWSTSFARFPENYKPTISLATIQRLLSVDIEFIDKPSYRWRNNQNHIIDISYLKKDPGYLNFCKEVHEINKSNNGFVMGRSLAEAAWCEVLLKRLVDIYEYAEDRQRLKMVLMPNMECLSACLLQVCYYFATCKRRLLTK